jgi:hypothetical protein
MGRIPYVSGGIEHPRADSGYQKVSDYHPISAIPQANTIPTQFLVLRSNTTAWRIPHDY